MLRKSFFVLSVLLLSFYIGNAQKFHFFCINIGEESNGEYIVNQINTVMKTITEKDSFVVYIRAGYEGSKLYRSVVIRDKAEWNETAPVIGRLKQYSVRYEEEVKDMMALFEPKYKFEKEVLSAKMPIYVYWFADQYYYNNYGKLLLMKFYYSCMGDKTWVKCFVSPDKEMQDVNSFQSLLDPSFVDYVKNNVEMKVKY